MFCFFVSFKGINYKKGKEQLKLLYISDSAIPSKSANSIHVMKMCQAFSKLGLEVKLIGKKTTAIERNIQDAYLFYGVAKNFKLKTYPFKPFPLSGRLYNFFLPFFTMSSQGLVYTRAIYPAFWYSLFGKSIAFEIHEPFDTKNRWLKYIFKFIIVRKKVPKWIVISSALKSYLIKKFDINPDCILIAHDGADSINFNDFKPLELQGSSKFRIGYVGSLLKGKGMDTIFRLSLELPQFDFHVVGGDTIQIDFWEKKLHSRQSNLFFHGFVSHAETPRYLNSFDVLLAPYSNSVLVKNEKKSNNIAQWMSPLKIFEYMSAQKPIVCSDLPVLREVLAHGKNAILCEPENVEGWKDAILRLEEDTQLRVAISKTAKDDFDKNYTWDQRASLILDFLKS